MWCSGICSYSSKSHSSLKFLLVQIVVETAGKVLNGFPEINDFVAVSRPLSAKGKAAYDRPSVALGQNQTAD